MNQKIGVPAIVAAVILVLVLGIFLYNQFSMVLTLTYISDNPIPPLTGPIRTSPAPLSISLTRMA